MNKSKGCHLSSAVYEQVLDLLMIDAKESTLGHDLFNGE